MNAITAFCEAAGEPSKFAICTGTKIIPMQEIKNGETRISRGTPALEQRSKNRCWEAYSRVKNIPKRIPKKGRKYDNCSRAVCVTDTSPSAVRP